MQFRHNDLGGGPPELVVLLDAGRNATSVIEDRNGVIGVDGHQDFIAVACERLVNRIVDDLEDHMMQTGAVGGIPDVHAGALTDGFQPFQYLDAIGVVIAHIRL